VTTDNHDTSICNGGYGRLTSKPPLVGCNLRIPKANMVYRLKCPIFRRFFIVFNVLILNLFKFKNFDVRAFSLTPYPFSLPPDSWLPMRHVSSVASGTVHRFAPCASIPRPEFEFAFGAKLDFYFDMWSF